MNVFELVAKLKLDKTAYEKDLKTAKSDADGKASGIGAAFGAVAPKLLAVGTAAVAAAGTAALAFGKSSVESYAQYEQLTGGVEKLFKQNSRTVIDYSSKAYKTAGMSANDYLDTVTSFSSSLISSLGGDTKKAAEYANRAVVDMSDNANTFGTNIESIQNAYQGFAKQNYTMLDNLKLGYGGTKEEMSRLVHDASRCRNEMQQLGVTVDGSSMSFDNIVNAISVMQKHMGISGTTAKEASKTIEGSVNTMKAAWQNLGTAMAQDTKTATSSAEDFASSVSTVFENVIPAIKNVLKNAGPAVSAIVPEILKDIGKAFKELAPELAGAGMEIMTGLLNGLADAAPTLIPNAIEGSINTIIKVIDNLPGLIEAGGRLLIAIVEGIIKAIPILIQAVPRIIAALVGALMEHAVNLVMLGAELGSVLINAIVDAIAGGAKALGAVIDNSMNKVNNSTSSSAANIGSSMGQVSQSFKTTSSDVNSSANRMDYAIYDAVQNMKAAWNIAKVAASAFASKYQESVALTEQQSTVGQARIEKFANGVRSAFNQVKSAINNSFLGSVNNEIESWIGGFQSAFSKFGQGMKSVNEGVDQAMRNIRDSIANSGSTDETVAALTQGINKIPQIFKTASDDSAAVWKKLHSDLNDVFSRIGSGVMSLGSSFGSIGAAASQAGNSAFNAFNSMGRNIINSFTSIGSSSSSLASQIGNAFSQFGQNVQSGIQRADMAIGNFGSSVRSGLQNAVMGAISSVANGFSSFGANVSSMLNSAAGSFSGFGSNVSNSLNSVVSLFSNFASGIQSAISSAISAVGSFSLSGMISNVSSAVNGILQSFQNLVNNITQIGVNVAQGFINGFTSTWQSIVTSVENKIQKLKQEIASLLDIHSPSKWAYKMGAYVVEGFNQGLDGFSESGTAIRKFMDNIDGSTVGITFGAGGLSNYNGAGGIVYNQTVNVNQPIASADELARTLRTESRYGLMRGTALG